MAREMKCVIVADDDPLLVSVLSEIFMVSGYTVRMAADGFAAGDPHSSKLIYGYGDCQDRVVLLWWCASTLPRSSCA